MIKQRFSMDPFKALFLLTSYFLSCLCLLFAGSVSAQAFPNKPIHIYTIQGPGTSIDLIGRMLAKLMESSLGQPVLVENRAGALGLLAADVVAKAGGDGYSLLLTSVAPPCLLPKLMTKDKLPFDFDRDLQPIAGLASIGYGLMVSSDSPVRSVDDFVKYAKSKSDGTNYGSPSAGSISQVAGKLFASTAGFDATHVAYKSSLPAMQDVAAGRLQYMFDTIGSSAPLLQAGRVRMLAVSDSKRDPLYPNIPTMEEAGFKSFVMTNWFGLYANSATPAAIADKIASVVVAANDSKAMTDLAQSLSTNKMTMGRSEFAAFHKSECEKMARLIPQLAISLE